MEQKVNSYRIEMLDYLRGIMAIAVMSYHLLIPLTYSYVISNYKLIFLNYFFLFAWVDPISYIAIGAWSIGNECVLQQLFFVK
ncbi:protein of unknown function [Acetoanaerobium sticklandii]|uniref:Acyltransferase 3 domain-containing protein n=1 Tax=Acetoanaerobium sticklandii (strain ATCC 12662 / DSM 519 / JCM 1433 / CCUG 9281 / NCIMB 10654 / HF) TaxID=499177 RepID=E3PV21_ACESD|nr:protein of unknown function [Acetoanaerobium sticklandii]